MKTHNKRSANNMHFKKRIKQRFGIDINVAKRQEIINHVLPLEGVRLSKTRKAVDYEYEGQPMRFIVDNKHRNIVTVLLNQPNTGVSGTDTGTQEDITE